MLLSGPLSSNSGNYLRPGHLKSAHGQSERRRSVTVQVQDRDVEHKRTLDLSDSDILQIGHVLRCRGLILAGLSIASAAATPAAHAAEHEWMPRRHFSSMKEPRTAPTWTVRWQLDDCVANTIDDTREVSYLQYVGAGVFANTFITDEYIGARQHVG